MPDARSRTVERILGEKTEPENESFTSERQHTAQAFNLHVERRDGRQSEGFAWSHYVGYRWSDVGEQEILVVLFGDRAVEIEGHKLGVLVAKIREGQLNSIRELVSRETTLFTHEDAEGPIISSVKSFPDFDELLRELKGEDDGHNRHTRRAAGR